LHLPAVSTFSHHFTKKRGSAMADDKRNRSGEQQQDGNTSTPGRDRQGSRSGTRRSGTSDPAGGSGGSAPMEEREEE
jgi:hypothetical protein